MPSHRFYRRLLWLLPVVVAVSQLAAEQTAVCTFRYQSPREGQNIWQHVTMFANLTTTYQQAGQTISHANQTVTREQIRRLVVLNASTLPTTKVRVLYEKAVETVMERGRDPEVRAQPVAGKAYVVDRPQEELRVVYEDGSEPTRAEVAIVKQNMQAVGRRNALAAFLQGKTVRIGERLDVPPELAEQLLGWKSEYGSVQSITLTLREFTEVEGERCAVFAARLSGVPGGTQTKPTEMVGDLQIEIATCRTLSADMQAQLSTREQRGPEGHTFTVASRGQARLHNQARFLATSSVEQARRGPAGSQSLEVPQRR